MFMYVILLSNKKEHTTDTQHRRISKTLCSAKETKYEIIIYISPFTWSSETGNTTLGL